MAQFQIKEGTRDGDTMLLMPVQVVVKDGVVHAEIAPGATYEIFNASVQVSQLVVVLK